MESLFGFDWPYFLDQFQQLIGFGWFRLGQWFFTFIGHIIKATCLNYRLSPESHIANRFSARGQHVPGRVIGSHQKRTKLFIWRQKGGRLCETLREFDGWVLIGMEVGDIHWGVGFDGWDIFVFVGSVPGFIGGDWWGFLLVGKHLQWQYFYLCFYRVKNQSKFRIPLVLVLKYKQKIKIKAITSKSDYKFENFDNFLLKESAKLNHYKHIPQMI